MHLWEQIENKSFANIPYVFCSIGDQIQGFRHMQGKYSTAELYTSLYQQR